MLETLPLVGLSQYEVSLYRAVYLVAYYGLFRLGELIHISNKQQAELVQTQDLSINEHTKDSWN